MTAPRRTSARPEPARQPPYQACTTAGTRSIHSVATTALPAWMATTVRGFAAATARMSSTSAGQQPQRAAVAAHAEPDPAAGEARRLRRRRQRGERRVEPLDDLGLVGAREELGERRVAVADVLALVEIRVADDDHGDVAPRRRRSPARSRSAPVVVDHVVDGGAEPVEDGSHSRSHTSLDPPSPRLTASARRPSTATRDVPSAASGSTGAPSTGSLRSRTTERAATSRGELAVLGAHRARRPGDPARTGRRRSAAAWRRSARPRGRRRPTTRRRAPARRGGAGPAPCGTASRCRDRRSLTSRRRAARRSSR